LGDGRLDVHRRLVVAPPGDGVLEQACAVDERVDAGRRQADLPFAHGAQVGLHLVREQLDLAVLHHPRDALQRVERPEQLLADGPIRTRLADRPLEREQRAANRRQVLVTLGKVVVEKVVEEFRHWRAASSSSRAVLAMLPGANGFVMYAVAPASSAAVRLASSPLVVRMITGT